MGEIENLKAELLHGLNELSIESSESQQQKLLAYLALLQKWNSAYNLTAIREPRAMLSSHLFDSLSIAPLVTGNYFIDVGTGPGLPGIPLAILFPEREFVLLDSNGKKTRFLFQAITTLGIKNATEINARVEKYQPQRLFDGVLSRAFTSLEDMVTKTRHLLVEGGHFYAMKGINPTQELSALPKAYKVSALTRLQVPELESERHLVVIKNSAEQN